MEHASVNGCGHQVVGSSDGVNVTGEMEIELKLKGNCKMYKMRAYTLVVYTET